MEGFEYVVSEMAPNLGVYPEYEFRFHQTAIFGNEIIVTNIGSQSRSFINSIREVSPEVTPAPNVMTADVIKQYEELLKSPVSIGGNTTTKQQLVDEDLGIFIKNKWAESGLVRHPLVQAFEQFYELNLKQPEARQLDDETVDKIAAIGMIVIFNKELKTEISNIIRNKRKTYLLSPIGHVATIQGKSRGKPSYQ